MLVAAVTVAGGRADKCDRARVGRSVLRAVEASEVPAVVDLVNRAYRGAGGGWTSEAALILGVRVTEAMLGEDLERRSGESLLVWPGPSSGTLGATVWLEPRDHGWWYLGLLAVEPALQGTGVGRAVLEAAEGLAVQRGGSGVRITVVSVREELIAWYRRRGYRPTGETEPFPYGDDRVGVPLRSDLRFAVLVKDLRRG